MIVWEFEWVTYNNESEEDDADSTEDFVSREQHNPYLETDLESDSDSETTIPSFLPTQTHTVTFKCMGSVHDPNSQEVLCKISRIHRDGGDVAVRVEPEPKNQYDSKAIAFTCQVDGKWQRIGYVVRECLEHVHTAVREKRLLSVKISWAKYLVCWSYSGPGYYAGINMSISGEWHNDVVHCQSTR